MATIVTAPLVIAKMADGRDVYLYAGSPLPEGLKDGEEKRLADYLGDDSDNGDKAPAKKAAAKKSE